MLRDVVACGGQLHKAVNCGAQVEPYGEQHAVLVPANIHRTANIFHDDEAAEMERRAWVQAGTRETGVARSTVYARSMGQQGLNARQLHAFRMNQHYPGCAHGLMQRAVLHW